jgi:putative SOS response-associated peptidase YedK
LIHDGAELDEVEPMPAIIREHCGRRGGIHDREAKQRARHLPLTRKSRARSADRPGTDGFPGGRGHAALYNRRMCGRAILTATPDDLRELLGLTEVPAFAPRYNIAPTQPIAVVRAPGRLELLRWGLSKGTAKGGAKGNAKESPRETRINVRAESVMTAYRESFAQRRCLVVVDGFYEWQRVANVARGASRPFLLRREDGKPFVLAGIWASRVTEDGEVMDECAVVTGASTGVVAELHDRMPVILSRESLACWLTGKPSEASALLIPTAEGLTSYAVSSRVNSPANDDPRCIEPAPAEPPKGNLTLFG